MKKLITLSTALFSFLISTAQTATNFTATDCNSNSHELFSELNAGKTIVIVWVMPCSACISAAATASSVVSAMSDPDVLFYLVDDNGNTSCSTLSSWSTSNQLSPNSIFDNTGNLIDQSLYGIAGMPKTAVVGGGSSHTVYLNQNGTVNVSDLQTAINNSKAVAGIQNTDIFGSSPNIYSLHNADISILNFTLKYPSMVNVEVYNLVGQSMFNGSSRNFSSGSHEIEISTAQLPAGIYFLKMTAGIESNTLRFSISK